MRAILAALVLLTLPTAEWELLGSRRVIRRIEFWYRSRLRRGAATVRVFGRK